MAFNPYLTQVANLVKTRLKTEYLAYLNSGTPHADYAEIAAFVGQIGVFLVPEIRVNVTVFRSYQMIMQFLLMEPDKPTGIGGNAMISDVNLVIGLYSSYNVDDPGLAELGARNMYKLWAIVDGCYHGWLPALDFFAQPFERTRGFIPEPYDFGATNTNTGVLFAAVTYVGQLGKHLLANKGLTFT